mmetsp:Transcript_14931/g.21768  ORF Transcript_14931/g.21768 Transcript_14931/m.21768 type:complete len:99 (+) Transcript_14931:430-726(+)
MWSMAQVPTALVALQGPKRCHRSRNFTSSSLDNGTSIPKPSLSSNDSEGEDTSDKKPSGTVCGADVDMLRSQHQNNCVHRQGHLPPHTFRGRQRYHWQ